MATPRKPLKRPPLLILQRSFDQKNPQKIQIPAEDILFLEKISEGKSAPKKAPPVSLQFGGYFTQKVQIMTLVDSVKVVAAECHNLTFLKQGKRSYREPPQGEQKRFLNSIETQAVELFNLLSEGKEEGHYRFSYAEEFLLAGTLNPDDDPAIIKNLRRDLEFLKDLIGRKRELQKQGEIVNSMFDKMRKRKDQGQPISDEELVNFLVKEHTLEHHYASKLVNEKDRRLYSPSKKGRPEDTLWRFTWRNVEELCTNWGIEIEPYEPDKPAKDEEPSQASSSDFFRVIDIVFSAAGEKKQNYMNYWRKYKKNPVETLP